MITLADENSLWGSDVYISVRTEVPGSDNVRLSGRFLSKVFEGPFKGIRKWMRRMNDFVAQHTTTCAIRRCLGRARVSAKNGRADSTMAQGAAGSWRFRLHGLHPSHGSHRSHLQASRREAL